MDQTLFFRRLIEETRIAFKLPALSADKLEAAVKDVLAGSDAARVWETAQKIGPESYLEHHRTVAGAVLHSWASSASWIERVERSVKTTSQALRNPLVLGASILGVSICFKAISKMLDQHQHHRAAALEKDVVRALQTTALTGNVPFLTLASVGDKLIDAAGSPDTHRSYRRAHGDADLPRSHAERVTERERDGRQKDR